MLCIRSDFRDGDVERIADLHTKGYANLGPRFGAPFDSYVLETLKEANLKARSQDENDRTRIWFAELDGQTVGCAALVDRGERAQLRWVVVLDEARGNGIGRKLLDAVLSHAKETGFDEIYLETIDQLTPSMTLYERSGFKLLSQKIMPLWYGENGCEVVMNMKLR